MFLVMSFLIFDVLHSLINYRLTHRKCTIATLPFKTFILRIDCFNPSAAVSLQFFNDMGNALVFGQQE